MGLSLSRKRQVLIFLMAGCLFFSLTAHSVAASIHPAAADCKIKAACLACAAVSVRSDSPEINPATLVAIYQIDIIIATPMIVPEPFYHPPR